MKRYPVYVLMALGLFSCNKAADKQGDETPVVSVETVQVQQGDISNSVDFNGKTVFLKKNTVVAPISGYVLTNNVRFGERVSKNQCLMKIQTKENKAIGNSAGIVEVTAPVSGIISSIDMNGTGGYVTEGSALCSIAENHAVIQVSVPFNNMKTVRKGAACRITLPDNTEISGKVNDVLPVMDAGSQTQQVIIEPANGKTLPENMNLTVSFASSEHKKALLIPKQALMTNETQTEWWVMKVFNHRLARQIPVQKGMESDSVAEIISPELQSGDDVILKGAYGMNDSTAVKVSARK